MKVSPSSVFQRNTPFSLGSIDRYSEDDDCVPKALSATTGSENCTCMDGYFTCEGSAEIDVEKYELIIE